MKSGKKGQLRIIGGQWRSRKLEFLDREGLRPTPDRVRETLFNWLQADIAGSHCLDLFAGSGALGFEAASRGAASVLMLDYDVATVNQLQYNAEQLDAGMIKVVNANVLEYLQRHQPDSVYDLVFIDPPYQSDLLIKSCCLLERQQWFSNHAKIYLECDANTEITGLPENWHQLKSKTAGQVAYQLYHRDQTEHKQGK